MKHTKRIFAILLSMAMILTMTIAMSATVFAADETYTVTIYKDASDKAAHTYGAYQLFKGDLADEEGTKILSNITWGDNVTPATIITELNKLDGFDLAADATAAQVAKAISDKNYTANSAEAQALAEALNKGITGSPKGTASVAADAESGEITGLAPGYYLVKDTAAVSGEGASTKYILEVVSDVEVTEKASVPSVDKTVGDGAEYGDYNIGDPIPYSIKGTLPAEFAKFTTYKTFTFTDEMSAGLTPPAAGDVTVKIGSDDITALFNVAVDGQKITVSLKNGIDLKTATHGSNVNFAAGDEIVVSYNATLNDNAVIGGTGNVNTAKLEFSNNPNSDGDGDTGTTPEDKTVVFTYKILANKVDENSEPLAGAGFTLFKEDGTVVKEYAAGETVSFEFKGVDAGTYILRETTVPAGYNKVDDITITVTPTYDATKDPVTLTALTCTPDTFTATASTGTVEGNIINEKGATLPSTGGIGTIIFYVLGSLLVVGCGIVLISKRRVTEK